MYSMYLLEHMLKLPITYGFYDFELERKFSSADPEWDEPNLFREHYNVVQPEVLEDLKIGTCFDTSLYAWSKLMDYDSKLLFIESDDGRQHMMTYYTSRRFWFWFEYSWAMHIGIHGPFRSKEELVDNFVDVYAGREHVKTLVDGVSGSMLLSMGDTIPLEEFYSVIYGRK